MDIKACIFDLDGVVVDTAKYHYLAWKRLANQLGFDFTEEQNEQLKGVSRMASLEILLKIGDVKLSNPQKEEYASLKNQWYCDYVMQMKSGEVLPGAITFLNELKDAGYKLALGSASKNAITILEKTDIMHYFDAIIDGNKTQKAKPDPEVFLLGAKALGVLPEQCVVFEDAEAGVEAALAADMLCVGVGNSSTLHKAHMLISGLHEMTLEKLKCI